MLSLLSKTDEKGPAGNHGSQGYLNPFSPIVRFLATPQRHIITSPDTYRHWRRTFLGTYQAIFLMFNGILSRSATTYSLFQCGPTTGTRAACGRHSVIGGPRQHSEKIFKPEICWKAREVTFVSLNCLRWIKWVCTRTMNTISVHHHCICFIYFTIKLGGGPSAGAPRWITSVFFVSPAFVVLKSRSGAVNSVPPNKSVCLSAKCALS